MAQHATRLAVGELVTLFDHVLEEHGFGWDHWHSILWNLHNVAPAEWDQLPQGGGRTIRQLVLHIGAGFVAYANHAFGDGTRAWNDVAVNGIEPGSEPAEVERWLRAAHGMLRDCIVELTDDQLGELRKAPWGDEYEIRRLIELQLQTTFYHVGEINHIRALLQGNDDWDHQDMGREDV
jgi:uncharacterized damage-inducible protein DinB